jgi:mono/diheme cytochrome c family protein
MRVKNKPAFSIRCKKPALNIAGRLMVPFFALILCVAANGSWLKHVPNADRRKVNPYAGQPDAIAAGAKMFSDHCAQCHRPDARGRGRGRACAAPGCRGRPTDGEIFWLLRNGNLRTGMPDWSFIPGPSRWQIIAYVKSLGARPNSNTAPGADPKVPVTPLQRDQR